MNTSIRSLFPHSLALSLSLSVYLCSTHDRRRGTATWADWRCVRADAAAPRCRSHSARWGGCTRWAVGAGDETDFWQCSDALNCASCSVLRSGKEEDSFIFHNGNNYKESFQLPIGSSVSWLPLTLSCCRLSSRPKVPGSWVNSLLDTSRNSRFSSK